MRTLLDAFAQYERARTRARIESGRPWQSSGSAESSWARPLWATCGARTETKPPQRETTHQVGPRVPESLLKQIHAHAERLRRETGVMTPSRTDAALALLVRGLEAVEGKSGPR